MEKNGLPQSSKQAAESDKDQPEPQLLMKSAEEDKDLERRFQRVKKGESDGLV
jgi:hypothetical protein